MQSGQHGCPGGIEHVLATTRGQRRGHVVDVGTHPEVDDHTVQSRCPLNQHGAQSLSDTIWRTAALSAPSGDADGTAGGGWGRTTGTVGVDDVRGSAAYLAATCAIDTSIISPPPRGSASPT